jgi:hypothetical protein
MFDEKNQAWCPTKVNKEGMVITGYWGDCHETCPLDINGTSNSILTLILTISFFVLIGGWLT